MCALIMIDLSRISQELVMFSGYEFGFVRLSDSVTTGSSIMPQKRNADMAELIRGRTGRTIANWVTLATTMKGLPMTAGSDAHHASAIGTAYTILNTDDFSVKGLLEQITKGTELNQRYLSPRDALRKTWNNWLRLRKRKRFLESDECADDA
jgi:argininosuccinate lyase